MFVDERQRVSHRRGAIARGVAKRCLVAFLAFVMAFCTTPAQLWAEGAEGIAEAVAQAATPSEGTGAADGAADGVVSETGSNASDASVNDCASANAADSNGVASDDSAAVEAPTASPDSSEQNVKSVVAASDEAESQPTEAASQEVAATCSVVGTDAKGAQQTWAAAQQIALKEGSTAADLSEQLFRQAGLKADYDPNGSWGWALNSITSPFDADRTLAYDPATGAYWQLFVNGSASAVGAGGYTLKDGDSVVWCYSKYGDPAPANQISVSCTVVGQDASGAQQTWAQPTTALVEEGTTAADLSEQAFKKAGIGAKTGKGTYGWYLESLTSPFNKTVTLSSEKVNENTWKFWQFFVNGQAANVGAGNYTLKAGDKVTWVYGFDGTMPGQVSVSMEIIGKKDEKAQRWTDPSTQVFVEGTTIKDASAAYFDAIGIESKMYDQFGYWGVHSLFSPLDGTELSGAWSFFVNGVPGPQLDSDYVLKSGDKIVWAYAPGDTVPNPDEVVVDPSASRPTGWKADWSGNSNAVVKNVSTPTGTLASSWTFDWRAYSGATYPNASEPIVVNGNVYLAVNKRLLRSTPSRARCLPSRTFRLRLATPRVRFIRKAWSSSRSTAVRSRL